MMPSIYGNFLKNDLMNIIFGMWVDRDITNMFHENKMKYQHKLYLL